MVSIYTIMQTDAFYNLDVLTVSPDEGKGASVYMPHLFGHLSAIFMQ